MKKIIICLISIFLLVGCSAVEDKIYLTDKYYDNSNNSFLEIDEDKINDLKGDTYILYVFNSFCKFSIPCDSIFEEFMKNNNISIISIPYDKYKKTDFVKKVKYAPTIIIIHKNKIVAYLDADKDEDVDKYQDIKAFTNWVNQYVYLEK